jgi:fructose-1,6-bisphosphatase II
MLNNINFVRATEAAAIAASAWVGSGNKLEADKAATDAMRERLNRFNIYGRIIIGEGIKDKSHGLYQGEIVGNQKIGISTLNACELAVDPIDGTTPTVNGGSEAMSVLAVSSPNSMFACDDFYMLKLAVSGTVAQKTSLSLEMPIMEICHRIAVALNKPVDKLMVCILDRPRHESYINDMRSLGVRIKLIKDCDISGAIAAAELQSIDLMFGIGGAPEAVITAAAIKCLRGLLLAQVWDPHTGLKGDILNQNNLIKGDCIFSATGITNGSLLKGVSWNKSGPVTNSVFMRSESGTVRWIETRHGN